MGEAFEAEMLPVNNDYIDYNYFIDELIDATAKLEVYKEKILDSKLDSGIFLPALQTKEAYSSSVLEGTRTTLDGVFESKVSLDIDEENIKVVNYFKASQIGRKILTMEDFSHEWFCTIHKTLMEGVIEKHKLIGEYRKEQNFVTRNNDEKDITYTPPKPEKVPELMDNLISYINNPSDKFKPLVRIAIIHAQFETIHPFDDGNGRVGRMLIPLYLYYTKQIKLPYFFISESLEQDKLKYYTYLNNIRNNNDWNEWIKFFLKAVKKQCEKYIGIITEINELYDKHTETLRQFTKSSNVKPIMDMFFEFPVNSAKNIAEQTGIPTTSVNRLLNSMVERKILFTNGKKRNKLYIYHSLLDIIR